MELDIFELLFLEKKPVSAEHLGEKYKYQPSLLARLFNCLTALKLIKKTRMQSKGGKKTNYEEKKVRSSQSKKGPEFVSRMIRLSLRVLHGSRASSWSLSSAYMNKKSGFYPAPGPTTEECRPTKSWKTSKMIWTPLSQILPSFGAAGQRILSKRERNRPTGCFCG